MRFFYRCGVTRKDRVRNKIVYEKYDMINNVVNRMASSQLRRFGYVKRMSHATLIKKIF